MKLRDPALRDAIAASYVVGTLRGPARVRFEHLRERDQALRAHTDAWEAALAPLAAAAAPLAPPARVWSAIAQRLEFERAPSPRRARWQLPAWAAVAAVLVLAIGLWWSPLQERLLFSPQVEVALQDEQHQPVWQVEADLGRDQLRVRALRDVAVADDRSLELWLLRGSGQAPVSLGLMPVRQGESRSVRASLALRSGNGFAVSLEPRGGSPTHLPTGPVLYVQKFRVPA